jgi:hypothetical protein
MSRSRTCVSAICSPIHLYIIVILDFSPISGIVWL